VTGRPQCAVLVLRRLACSFFLAAFSSFALYPDPKAFHIFRAEPRASRRRHGGCLSARSSSLVMACPSIAGIFRIAALAPAPCGLHSNTLHQQIPSLLARSVEIRPCVVSRPPSSVGFSSVRARGARGMLGVPDISRGTVPVAGAARPRQFVLSLPPHVGDALANVADVSKIYSPFVAVQFRAAPGKCVRPRELSLSCRALLHCALNSGRGMKTLTKDCPGTFLSFAAASACLLPFAACQHRLFTVRCLTLQQLATQPALHADLPCDQQVSSTSKGLEAPLAWPSALTAPSV